MADQEQEIALFSKLAKDWWDQDGPMKPLHQLNPLRLEFIGKDITWQQNKIADLGCGGGLLSEAMATLGADVVGVDLSEAVIQVARDHAENNNVKLEYICEDIAEFTKKRQGQFDVVTCMELIEHVEDPLALLTSAFELLKPGGLFFISTINRTAKAFIKTILGAEYILGILPKGTHHYKQFIKPSECMAWAEKVGFELSARQGVGVSLFSEFYLSDDMSCNYMLSFMR